jgi:S1-C subfamily serine protease
MEIEELNKTQLVLLALLVSFVTSIATGIATVSLIEQAPSDVTRVINRVVERTVETIKPVQGASVITKETTVIVKEEDAITNGIALVKASSVAVQTEAGLVLGSGFVTKAGTLVVTNSSLVSVGGSYIITFTDGATTTAKTLAEDDKNGIALLTLGEEKSNASIKIGNVGNLKLGQSILVVRGSGNNVATGIISELVMKTVEVPSVEVDDNGKEKNVIKTKNIVSRIRTNIGGDIPYGTPLVDLFGEVIGIAVGDDLGFIPVSTITELIPKSTSTSETTESKV